MLIQNISNMTVPQQTPRLASDGAPKFVADTAETRPNVPQASPRQPSAQELKSAVDSINIAMRQANKSLELSIDPGTKTPVVTIKDSETGERIGQFPSERVLAIAQSIDQFLNHQGGLLKQKA